MIDSHCHLASHKFSREEIPAILERAQAAGIQRVVTLGTSLEDWAKHREISHEFPSVELALGIHPCDVHAAPDDAVAQLASQLDDVCAIGETGLDYFHPAPQGWTDEDFRARQRDFLRQHFVLAAEKNLPIILHTRDQQGSQSLQDALAIYRDFSDQTRAVFHCFISTYEDAEEIFSLGGLVSFGGVATFKSAQNVFEVAKSCPAGSFMLETDAPYLAPIPHRGKRNEPAFVRHVAEFLAHARGESLEQLVSHTTHTAEQFFRFKKSI